MVHPEGNAEHRVSKDAPPGAPFEAASRRLRARRLGDLDEARQTAEAKRSFRGAKRNASPSTAYVIEIIIGVESAISRDRLFSITYRRFHFADFVHCWFSMAWLHTLFAAGASPL